MEGLRALLWKNFILWKRGGFCAFCEIILPLLFCLFFFQFRALADKENMPETLYLEENDEIDYLIPYTLTSEFPNNLKGKEYNEIISEGLIFQNCIDNKENGDLANNGNIALSPGGLGLNKKLKGYFENFGFSVAFYDSEQDVFDYIQSDEYKEDICAGVSFLKMGENSEWEYHLHFNTTDFVKMQIPSENDEPKFKNFQIENIEDFVEPWISSGFVTLQNWIDNLIIQEESGKNVKIKPTLTSMRTQEYVKDELPQILVGNIATYTILPLIIVFMRLLQQIVHEKEQKIREQMKIMGLNSFYFYMGWFLHYGIFFLIISLLTTLLCYSTIFPHSNFFLVLLWYYLYCLNLVMMGLLLSSFFFETKIANIVGLIVYLAFYIVTVVIGGSANTSTTGKTLLSIIPQVNLSLSADVFILIETKSQGIGWGDLGVKINQYSIGLSLIMFVISFLLQLGLFLYFEQVFPSEIGVKKHPLFCLGFKHKNEDNFNNQKQLQNSKIQNNANIEEVEEYLKEMEKNQQCIKIKNLGKVYSNGKKAVNGLDLTMYKNQIFCLLGHNGSGKSTTISMLTGMISVTQGDVQIFDMDLQTQMQQIRKYIGICPQHDILFGNLTVYEHLKLFSRIKRRKRGDKLFENRDQDQNQKNEFEQEIEKLLEDVDLKEKRDFLAKNLSGGQKRRLSVAMAFVGGSKIIYLDEPTSGCDTSVRRHIWEMLKKYKENRIIVLTTHFMDEADYLGDRISIIGEGKLICTGSPNFLKNRFGVGYNLTIVKNDPMGQNEGIIQVVKKHIQDYNEPQITSAEILFQLKMQEVGKFEGLFEELDTKKEKLGIQNYGISITTMEQVFLEVCEKYEKEEQLGEIQQQSQENQIKVKEKIQQNQRFELNKERVQNSYKLFKIHFWALILKRLNYIKRDKRGLCCEIILPCILLIFGVMGLNKTWNSADKAYLLQQEEILDFKPKAVIGQDSSVDQNAVNLIIEQINYDFSVFGEGTVQEWDLFVYENMKEEEEQLGAYYFEKLEENGEILYLIEINSLYRDALPMYLANMNEALAKYLSGNNNLKINTVVSSFPWTKKLESLQSTNKGNNISLLFALLMSFIPSSLIGYIIKEKEQKIKHQQIISGVSLKAYWFSNYIYDFAKFIFPVYLLSLAVLQIFQVEEFTKGENVFLMVSLLLFFYGFSVIFMSYFFSFFFKSEGSGQILVFFHNYLVGGILAFLLLFLPFFFQELRDTFETIAWPFRIFPCFSLGYGMSRVASRKSFKQFFDDVSTVKDPFDPEIALYDLLSMIFMTFVYAGLVFLIEFLERRGGIKGICRRNQSFNNQVLNQNQNQNQNQSELIDSDVLRENEKINTSSQMDYAVRLESVKKVFKQGGQKIEAVKQVSLGVQKGECFALLGINGAGKTTLFKILAGEHQATYGNVHINGINMTTDMEKARYHIGYCPQFDALLDKLTAKEHLELYAAIKGIPKQKREYLIEEKLDQLNLKKFENVPAGTYSGGNKRKLSVAIALLGNPPIILLDEPSTGMDPKARRFMWTVISEICSRNQNQNQKQQNNEKNSDAISKATIQNGNQGKNGSFKIQVREKENPSCVILSTHSMEEAEALSNKMTIMVQGGFKCLGSIQHIKSKFGQGYEIEVKVKIPKQYDLEKLINEEGSQNKKQNENLKLNFQVNMKNLDQVLQQLGEKVQKVVLKEKNKKNEKNGRNFIFSVLENGQSVSLQILLEFYLIQEKNQIIEQFISSKFRKYQIIENYGSFTRYKIDTKESTGKIFAFFENAKQNLGIIDSYSVRQTTIEAIFNQFANNAISSVNLQKNQANLNQLGIQIKEQKYFQGDNQVVDRNILKMQNNNQQNENQNFQTQLIKVKTNEKN